MPPGAQGALMVPLILPILNFVCKIWIINISLRKHSHTVGLLVCLKSTRCVENFVIFGLIYCGSNCFWSPLDSGHLYFRLDIILLKGLSKHTLNNTCGFVLTCMQTEEFEMHASTKIIVVTGFTTELHAGRQRVHFSILQPFLLTTYGNNRRLEDIVSDK